MKSKNNILVVIFGCLGRSLHYTNINHVEKIFDTLSDNNISYKTCYINNDVDKIDGVRSDTSYKKFKNVVNSHFKKTISQNEIDSIILKKYPKYKSLFGQIGGDNNYERNYIEQYGLNPIRNSYIETLASEYINQNKSEFSHSLVFCSDLWFDKKLDINWFNETHVIVSDVNPGDGYTNGFYFGKSSDIDKLLNSFGNLSKLATHDYERIIKNNSKIHSISVRPKKYRFLKIRATGKRAYNCRGMRRTVWKKIRHIESDFFEKTKKKF